MSKITEDDVLNFGVACGELFKMLAIIRYEGCNAEAQQQLADKLVERLEALAHVKSSGRENKDWRYLKSLFIAACATAIEEIS